MDCKCNDTAYTITDWLQGKVAIAVTQETINSICFDREVEPEAGAGDVDVRERDLCLADLYMWCATLPTTTGSVDDKNGNWEHKEGSVTMSASDKKQMRLLARRLYRKWGLLPPSMSAIRCGSMGIANRKPSK